MLFRSLTAWVSENRQNLIKYKDFLEFKLEDIKSTNINIINRETDLLEKGKAQLLIALIEELRI